MSLYANADFMPDAWPVLSLREKYIRRSPIEHRLDYGMLAQSWLLIFTHFHGYTADISVDHLERHVRHVGNRPDFLPQDSPAALGR